MSALAPDELRRTTERLWEHAERLWRAGAARRADALGGAFSLLASADHPLGAQLRRELPDSTGLSPEGVEWALRSAVAPLTAAALRGLLQDVPPVPGARMARPGRLLTVILAGNVFTAAARALALPLLLGWPVLAKASSRDDTFPKALAGALAQVDEQVAEGLAVVSFPGGHEPLERALLERADCVSIYGSDQTLKSYRDRLDATTAFLPHGHGLGVALVGKGAAPGVAAEALSWDVAAYDQRGCLSPHAVWVERGGAASAEQFARALFRALADRARDLPRGPLPMAAGAAQLQWRGVGAARGQLLEGDGFSVSAEGDGALRLSPGYRNVQVLEARSLEHFARVTAPLGAHLKALGVAGVDEAALCDALPAGVAPHLSPLGAMQTPSVGAPADGVPWWQGLIRWL